MSNNNKLCLESYINGDYPVDVESNIPPELRAQDANTAMPAAPVNGGLYCGPQNNAPWMPKYVPPTTTFFMQNLVRNADPAPPPGVAEQYPGDNRLGNNYTPMPGVNWYNSAYNRNPGPFNIKVIDDKWNTDVGGNVDSLVTKRNNNKNNNNNLALNNFDLTQY